MFGKVRRTLSELRSHTSGNATLLLAFGLPAVVGGSGLAVDMSQWYMWKRDLQYAVDQAALAGAWTMTNNSTTVQDTYATRARQEYDANLAMVGDFDTTPTVALAAYGAGQTTNNSVVVTSTAARQLPFSSFLTGRTTTVYAKAQATYSSSASWSVCIFATHPTAQAAFKFGGSVSGSTTCGVGTLSNHPTAAMFEAGNTNNDLGNLVATGGIDSSFSNNGNNRMHPNVGGLSDPYAGITAPSATGGSQTYFCPTARAAYTTADVQTVVAKSYKYYTKSGNSYTLVTNYNGTYKQTDFGSDTTQWDIVVTSTTGSTVGPSETDYVKYGNGSDTIYIKTTTTTTTSYSDIKPYAAVLNQADLSPGIYSSIQVACTTNFAPGLYFVSGTLDFGQNQVVRGTGTGGVMFVMTNASSAISINSNSDVRLTGISKSLLMSNYSVSESDASKLAGMLIFDKLSTSTLTINGNSNVKFGGTIYVPNRDVKMNGDGAAAGVCMMVAGSTVEFLGNFNIDNICTPPSSEGNINIGGSSPGVKLVV